MAAKKQLLTYPEDVYIPQAIQQGLLTEQQVRKEYSRLLAIAQKRYNSMVSGGMGKTQGAQLLKAQLKSIAEITADIGSAEYRKTPRGEAQMQRALSYHLTGISYVLGLKTSSLSGAKKARSKAVEKLQSYGYTEVTEENYDQFAEFMEQKRAEVEGNVIESDVVARVWNEAKRLNVSGKPFGMDFAFWATHIDEIEQLEPSDGRINNSTELRMVLEKKRKEKAGK